MVRKVDISSTVGPCTAAVLWAACYGDAQATREYHLRVNKVWACSAPLWGHACSLVVVAGRPGAAHAADRS